MKLSLVLCSIIAVGLIACASSKEEDPGQDVSPNQCVPNQTLRCPCNLGNGTQTCSAEGKLSKCDCRGDKTPTNTDGGNYHPFPVDPNNPPPPPPPVNLCGNNTVDTGEGCDDGNKVDGDGCSASCEPDGAPTSADTCPGQAVMLWKDAALVLAGTTEGYQDDVSTSCVPSDGPDRIYAISPSADGFMSVNAVFAAGFNAIVEVRRDKCDSSAAQVLCEDTFSTAFQRVVQVKSGHTYYVVVDSDSAGQTGAYTLHVELN